VAPSTRWMSGFICCQLLSPVVPLMGAVGRKLNTPLVPPFGQVGVTERLVRAQREPFPGNFALNRLPVLVPASRSDGLPSPQ